MSPRFNLRLRLLVAVAMIVVAAGAIGLRTVFATSYSNKCDPGNERFQLLKGDPALPRVLAAGGLTIENDGPDNSWLCSNPTLSVGHLGLDLDAFYDRAGEAFTVTGWSLSGSHWREGVRVEVFDKDTAGVVRISALVRRDSVWVQVWMTAPGANLGAPGF